MDYSRFRDYGEYLDYCYEEWITRSEEKEKRLEEDELYKKQK